MKYLITGGAGFIGSNLSRYLISKEQNVTVIDDLSTGRIDNIKDMEGKEGFKFYLDSILNYPLLEDLISSADIVVHLAAAVGVEYIINNPLKSIEINVEGTENVLKASNRSKKRVFIASTSEIYGKNEKDMLNEEDDRILGSTTKSRWSYSNTKALDEFLSLAYHHEKKLPVIIARFFNTTGPGQVGSYGMVVPRFIKQAILDKPITIYGDGLQTRCFSHVNDVVKAIDLLLNTERCYGSIFNVGNTEEISIKDLAEKIIEITGSKSEIIFIPYEEVMGKNFEDMKRRVPDISKIRQFTGWEPTLDLNDIIKDIVENIENGG